jgi:3-phenylpropionate/trans-cinnamate dioxygenase ferredoxin reductase subunit
VPGADLERVFTLRSVEDAEAIRDAATEDSRAVLVGAGFVGMELAASLTSRGVRSTIIESTDRVWARSLPPGLSDWMRRHYEAKGVSFRLNSAVERFEGSTRLGSVRLGSESIGCDFAVVGIGMEPCDGIAADAGLAVEDGIRVDAYGETTHPHIYAAGDVARFPDPVFEGHARVEHWEHAREHGRVVGRNMAGAREPYDLLSHSFSRVFELSLDVVGRPAQSEEVTVWGTPGEGPCVTFALSGGRLCGIVLLDAPGQLEAARALVGQRLPSARLDDEAVKDPTSLLALLLEHPGARDVNS